MGPSGQAALNRQGYLQGAAGPQVYVNEAHHTIENENSFDKSQYGGSLQGRVVPANSIMSIHNPATMASQKTLNSEGTAPGDMLAQEIKKIRLRISDYYRSSVLEPIFFKLWKLMVNVQYEKALMEAVSHASHIPLAIEVYEAIMPIYEVALGVYF